MRVTAFLNAYSEGMSGGDACFIEIAKRQPDWELTIVTSALGEATCRARGLAARFIILSHERVFHRPILTYGLRTLRGYLSRESELIADVYYATSDFLPDTLLARRLRRRTVDSTWVQKVFHLIPRDRRIPHLAQVASLALIRASADRVIVDNSLLKATLVARGFDIDRIGVNYPGIDAEYFGRLGDSNSKRYEGVFLGRLGPSKGVFDLVPIWRRVVTRHPKARLAVIGHGDSSTIAQLITQMRRERLNDNIDLLGYLSDETAFAILGASHVFLFPSYEEGFGMAALEAIAAGLPVVAYDLPAYSEVFTGGMLRVPVGNIIHFADMTNRLLEDNTLREATVRAASGLARRFDWGQVAAREAEEIALAAERVR